ncbi:MAG: hypothetical protein H6817_04170 [Phycisphaerales bacterium]|nr:hypothetical protein [Phycisphaerales bacterium]
MSDTMTTTAAKNDLASDLNALKKDLANLRSDFAGIAGGIGHRAKDRAVELGDSVQSAVKSSLSEAESRVQERPLTSVLVAFGAGVLVAKLLGK